MTDWKDVASAPPDRDKRLLLIVDGEVVIGFRNSFYTGAPWWHCDDDGPVAWGAIDPVFWMPLPPID